MTAPPSACSSADTLVQTLQLSGRPPCRAEQDAFAATSHRRAAAAAQAGKFKDEIVPVHTKVTDPKTKETRAIVVDADDGIRGSSTAEGLAKLKPAFKAGGSTTAGNSSQVLSVPSRGHSKPR